MTALKSTVFSVTGLGFGDEGKGTTVDYLARRHGAASVVCFTSGPQKAHHVVDSSGNWHCFSQFGSAMHLPRVITHISSQALLKPENLLREAQALTRFGVSDALRRLTIDPDTHLVTSLHALIGQLLEISRGANRHGSVGMGVGQAVLDRQRQGSEALTAGDLFNEVRLRSKLYDQWNEKMVIAEALVRENPSLMPAFQDFLRNNSLEAQLASYAEFAAACGDVLVSDEDFFDQAFATPQTLILEGGQGALLDPVYGFAPYVTKTPSTSLPADALLAPWKDQIDLVHVGVVRAYGHRHGAGPFVTHDAAFTHKTPEAHNQTNPWQGEFLTGWFDLPAVRYAIALNPGLGFLSLTCVDRLLDRGSGGICISYEYLGNEPEKLDTYFAWDSFEGGRIRITGIKRLDFPSEERTRLLLECKPLEVEEVDAADPLHFAGVLQEKLGIPIGIVSNGPTADHKIDLRGNP